MRGLITLLLIALPLVGVQGQDDLSDEAPEIRRYTVEMIIFKYAQDVSTGSEIFPAGKTEVADRDLEAERDFADEEPLQEVPRFYRDIEFERLARGEYSLGDILRRLERLDVYEPLMHFGWTQVTWPDADTRAIDLDVMATPPHGLDGSLRLYLGRFLHLVVELELDAPTARGDGNATARFGDDRSANAYGDFGEAQPVRYRISEDRIFRSGELRYFDHPKFGVLAKVSRVEEITDEMPETLQDPGETELLGYPPE